MVSDVYERLIRASEEIRSRASRSEMSRAWSETLLSSGAFQVARDASRPLEVEQDCAFAAGGNISDAIDSAIVIETRDAGRSARLLRTGSRRRSPVENGDVSLPLDASTE